MPKHDVIVHGVGDSPAWPVAGDRTPPLCGFQHAPGYPGGTSDTAGTSLTDGSGITVQSNTTYNYYKNLSLGTLGTTSVPISNVTFNGCLWESSGATEAVIRLAADGTVTFNYCTVRPTGLTNNTGTVTQAQGYQYALLADGTPAAPGTWNTFCKTLTVDHCDIWGYANAIMHQYSTQTTPHKFLYTWIHNSRTNDDGLDHTDGLGLPAGGTNSYVTIENCWIEDDGDTQGLAYQNTPGPSTFDNFVIRYNTFGGWGYAINVSNGTTASPTAPTNVTFTDNTFTTKIRPIYGPLYSSLIASGTGCLWRRNKWWVPSGAAWGDPAHDGWFWMPVSDNIVGTNDTPFVSQTDYTG